MNTCIFHLLRRPKEYVPFVEIFFLTSVSRDTVFYFIEVTSSGLYSDRSCELLYFYCMQLVTRVNYLNIGLMLVSCLAAYVLPFELFLFSYAVLGPLHYLTEIGWLHKRGYYTTGKKDYIWLLGLAIIIGVLYLVNHFMLQHKAFYDLVNAQGVDAESLSIRLREWFGYIIIMAFVGGLATVVFSNNTYKLVFTLVITALLILAKMLNPWVIILTILLPTIIHTTIFMLAFIFYGSLKAKSVSGYVSTALYAFLCVLFFIYAPKMDYTLHDNVLSRYTDSGFMVVNAVMLHFADWRNTNFDEIFYSALGLKVQRFIAFSYTYHYLNWFSKTNIINWHQVPRRWLITIIVLWVISVGLYAYDYRTGLAALFFLSMLHVFVEFPLNYRSILGIGQEMAARIKTTARVS